MVVTSIENNHQPHHWTMKHIYNDGGRAAAGYVGSAGDCVTRAIAIAAELPYQHVYDSLRKLGGKTPRDGVKRKVYDAFLKGIGWSWKPTMTIGSGCKVHLHDGELPMGRLVCRLSKHLCAVIDGEVHDSFDPQRAVIHGTIVGGSSANGTTHVARRCVYGFYYRSP